MEDSVRTAEFDGMGRWGDGNKEINKRKFIIYCHDILSVGSETTVIGPNDLEYGLYSALESLEKEESSCCSSRFYTFSFQSR